MSDGTALRKVREGELKKIRERHKIDDTGNVCEGCEYSTWPCDTRIVLDEVDRLKTLLREVR